MFSEFVNDQERVDFKNHDTMKYQYHGQIDSKGFLMANTFINYPTTYFQHYNFHFLVHGGMGWFVIQKVTVQYSEKYCHFFFLILLIYYTLIDIL